VDLSDEVGPASLYLPGDGWRGDLRDLGRFFFDFLLLSLSPGDVTVGAIVTDQLFSLIGDGLACEISKASSPAISRTLFTGSDGLETVSDS